MKAMTAREGLNNRFHTYLSQEVLGRLLKIGFKLTHALIENLPYCFLEGFLEWQYSGNKTANSRLPISKDSGVCVLHKYIVGAAHQ